MADKFKNGILYMDEIDNVDLFEDILNDKKESEEERKNAIKELSNSIKTTDEPVTSISIPYPNGENKYIYINSNDEFVIKSNNKETIYHYNEENDSFETENIELEER